MIIEFIGSTGAGKTTLLKDVQRRLATTTQVTTSIDLVTSLLGLRRVTNPTVQNIIQELVSFPFFISSLLRYKGFIIKTIRMFSRNTKFSIISINNLRSLERKIGVYEITKRHTQDWIILVDEGPLLAPHMFVYNEGFSTPMEITKYAELLPLPDLIIYVRASVDTLIKRTLQRPDPPRQLRAKNLALTEHYAKAAVTMFDQLVEAENFKDRLLIVDNPEHMEQGYDILVDNIAEYILNHKTSLS